MRAIILFSILIAIGLIIIIYKREKDLKKMLFSFALLLGVISLGVVGNVMRSLLPLFMLHLIALIFAYGGLIIYIIKDRFYWYLYLLPVLTILIYVLLAWIGNEHSPNISF